MRPEHARVLRVTSTLESAFYLAPGVRTISTVRVAIARVPRVPTRIALTSWPNPQASPSASGARRLRWKGVRGADYYNVQVYRGGRKILSAWPRGSQLQLKRRWTFGSRKYSMSPGTYQWYVWPGYGPRSRHRYGKLITHQHFTVSGRKKSN